MVKKRLFTNLTKSSQVVPSISNICFSALSLDRLLSKFQRINRKSMEGFSILVPTTTQILQKVLCYFAKSVMLLSG